MIRWVGVKRILHPNGRATYVGGSHTAADDDKEAKERQARIERSNIIRREVLHMASE